MVFIAVIEGVVTAVDNDTTGEPNATLVLCNTRDSITLAGINSIASEDYGIITFVHFNRLFIGSFVQSYHRISALDSFAVCGFFRFLCCPYA